MTKTISSVITHGIYRILNAELLVCICLFGMGSYLGIKEISFAHLLASFLVIAIFTGINYMQLRGRIVLMIAFVGSLFITLTVIGSGDGLFVARNYFYWLTGSGVWQEEWITVYEMLQAGLVAIVCYFCEVGIERYSVIRRVAAGGFLIWLLVCLFTKHALLHNCVVVIICYLLITYVEWMQSRWEKAKSGDTRSYMLWLMPFVIIYLVLMLLTPAPEKAYDWKPVKDVYKRIVETLTVWGQNLSRGNAEDFGMSMSGFSEQGILKGDIWNSDLEVMTVKGQTGLMTNVYLSGKIFDSFDGRKWEQKNLDTEEDRILDTVETVYAINRYEKNIVRNYLYGTTLQIKYRYFNTGYLFAPLKSHTVISKDKDIPFSSEGGNLVLDKRMGFGTEYKVQYYQMNVDHPRFYDFLEARLPEDEKVWNNVKGAYRKNNGGTIQYEELEAHRQWIYENYLHEVTLSEEVKEYLEEITEGAQTKVERLKAIERALSEMEYTRIMESMPSEVDNPGEFLDYFLLDKKEGYCTYYATAFILLAWQEGIPARYVQGFCVPISGATTVTVTSRKAHAWPEVYIDGIGWMPFEPTPGYSQIRYTPWEMIEATATDESLYEGAGAGAHYWQEDNMPTQQELMEMQQELEQEEKNNQFWEILGYTTLLAVCICLLVIGVDRLLAVYKYKRKTLSEQYKAQVNWSLRILDLLGYIRGEAETLQELRERALSYIGGRHKENTLIFLPHYEELLYGNKSVTKDMMEVVLHEQQELLKQLKAKKQKIYFIYRVKLFLLKYR